MIDKELDLKYKETYNKEAAIYDDDRFGSIRGDYARRFKNDLIYSILKKHNCLSHDQIIIDIPSGTGRVAHNLLEKSDVNIDAVDISTDMLNVNKKNVKEQWKNRIKFYEANMRNIPVKDNYYDAAVMASFLYLIPLEEYQEYTDDIWRTLKPGGVLILEVSNALAAMNPKTLFKIIYHKHIKRKNIKSYPYIWNLPGLFPQYEILSIIGTEFPLLWKSYSVYEKTSSILGTVPPFKWFSGKFTVVLKKP